MKIIGLAGSLVAVFVIILLIVFIYCCLIISGRFDNGKDNKK